MKNSNYPIHVAVIEDDSDTRQMWQILINGQPNYSCQHTYDSMEAALEYLPQYPYINVVMVDIEIPNKMNGIKGVRLMNNHPNLKHMDFIMLTVHEETELIYKALENGATGYMSKDSPPQKILGAIEEATLGGAPMSMSIARKVRNYFVKPHIENPLTSQEMKILELTNDGKDDKIIASDLYISYHTVRTHKKNIYKKLQVNSKIQMLKEARRRGLLDD